MADLKPDAVLKRASGITTNLDSSQDVKISLNGSSIYGSNHCLAILNAFAQPISVREALKKLQSAGMLDWMELTGATNSLYKLGALREPSKIRFVADRGIWEFGSALAHVSMLNDTARTESFIRAVGSVVKKGDTVLDIGTGTGILAIAPARRSVESLCRRSGRDIRHGSGNHK